MKKEILLISIILLIPFVVAGGIEIQDYKEDNLGLVWNSVNFQLGNIFTSIFEINYLSKGYYIDDIFYTSQNLLNGNLNYYSSDPCRIIDGSIINLKNYYEFFKTLNTGLNTLKFECGKNVFEKKINYDPNLKVPIYDLLPISSTKEINFPIKFSSRIDLNADDCSLINEKGEEILLTKLDRNINNFETVEPLSLENQDYFNLSLNCSKEGYKDYTKGLKFSSDEWTIVYDTEIKIIELNLTNISNSYDLLNETYDSPYNGDEIIFNNKEIKLKININETGTLKIKNLYYNPQIEEINIPKEGLEYNFSIGNYFLSNNYIGENNIEIDISDLAGNNLIKSYKINYVSEDLDIVAKNIEGYLYDDFVLIIENFNKAKDNTLKINGVLFLLSNCININENDKKCLISTSNYLNEIIDPFVIQIESKNSQIIQKNYIWIKNIYNFEYKILEYNFLNNLMPIYDDNVSMKFSFNKNKELNYKINIINHENKVDSIYFNQAFLESTPNKGVKSYSYKAQENINYIRIQFFVNETKKYEFDYLFEKLESLNYKIEKLEYRSNYDNLVDQIVTNVYKSCGNNICENEDCKEDCFKEISEVFTSGSYEYLPSSKIQKYTFSNSGKNFEINIRFFEDFSIAQSEFKIKEFENFKIINESIIFKYKDTDKYFYLSGNYFLEFDDNDNNEISNLLLKRYKSDSKLSFEVALSNNYMYSIENLPNYFKHCEKIDKIQIFNNFNITFCKKKPTYPIVFTTERYHNFKVISKEINSAVILNEDYLKYAQYTDVLDFSRDYYVKNLN